ncbi:hypothetical protein GYMLUDRAFT_265709 [Collybiopsis luxurians FD-317 M1]|uniref:Unplaced genomic scaffold GYMLUscaffold_110, whole genome shotgun sequence n=1 Tax=Collybiopsis luxurians FD-317 M1 TaxID=944289 RepID=A0A0D0AN54_9AGAR|nr:hypothetical protein GYMLUDRAFT_265709 [Collybiopsis luxurians FD-317 M1]
MVAASTSVEHPTLSILTSAASKAASGAKSQTSTISVLATSSGVHSSIFAVPTGAPSSLSITGSRSSSSTTIAAVPDSSEPTQLTGNSSLQLSPTLKSYSVQLTNSQWTISSTQSFNSQLISNTQFGSLQSPSSTQSSLGPVSAGTHKLTVSPAVIAGIVVGSVAVLLVTSFTIFLLRRRRRTRLGLSQHIDAVPTSEVSPSSPESASHSASEKSSLFMDLTSPSWPGDNAGSTLYASDLLTPTKGSLVESQSIETRLEFLQNLVTQIMINVQRIESRIEHENGATMARSEARPPTYASG